MKHLSLAAILLASTAATPALAETIIATSQVDAVTVYPSGAEVTRVATAEIAAGEHALVFEGLPGDLDPATIRVEGDAAGDVQIGSVDARLSFVPAAQTDAQRRALETDIERLQDERAVLDQTIADAEYQKGLMQTLAARAGQGGEPEQKPQALDAAGLAGLLDLVGTRLQSLSKLVLDSRVRQRQIDREIGDIHNRIAGLAPVAQAKTQVTVHLAAPAQVKGTFRLKYRIQDAGWQPIYDARLTTPDKNKPAKIEIVRRAAVMQSTVEDWSNVSLTLSTARPVGATAAPEIFPQRVDSFETGRAGNYQQRSEAAPAAPVLEEQESLGAAQDAAQPMARKVAQAEAQMQTAGFQALYSIPGRVSVDNTGTAKNVRIATSEVEAQLSVRAVPKLDPNAYLTATFLLNGESPLLPGAVMLYRDGVFMGQGALPLLSPGEETKLGFGIDDMVKVKRVEVKRQRGEEGLITTSNTDERAYDITIKNLHDFTMAVTILDQMPYSVEENIVVETLPGMTPPTFKDFEKKRGVLAWNFDIEANAQKVLKHGFKVTWPENVEVGMNLD